MTTKENYETLKATIEALSVDFEKFDTKKVKAAGQRARNHLLTAKKLCDTLRKQIITEMRELPTRHRITDDEGDVSKESESNDDDQEEKGANGAHESEITEETHDIKPIEIMGTETVIATLKKDKPKRKPRKANKKKEPQEIVVEGGVEKLNEILKT